MNRALAVLLLAALVTGAGCSSFAKLRSEDPALTEDEVAAAGAPGAPADLVPHLVNVVMHRDRYSTGAVVAAVEALGRRNDPSAVPALAGLAHDPNEELRWHAARALKSIDGAAAASALADMAAHDASELVREEAGAAR